MKLRTTLNKSSFLRFNVRYISQWTSCSKSHETSQHVDVFSSLFVHRKKTSMSFDFSDSPQERLRKKLLKKQEELESREKAGKLRSYKVGSSWELVGNKMNFQLGISWELIGKNALSRIVFLGVRESVSDGAHAGSKKEYHSPILCLMDGNCLELGIKW